MFSYIFHLYGQQTRLVFRLCSNTSAAIVKSRCRLSFLKQCARHSVIPPSLKVKSLVKSYQGLQIAKKASLKFISAAITFCYRRLHFMQKKLHSSLTHLFNILTPQDCLSTLQFFKSLNDSLKAKLAIHFNQKFTRLFSASLKSSYNKKKNDWICNLSSKPLSPLDHQALNLGLNYAFGQNRPNIPQILASIEPALIKLNPKACHSLRVDIAKSILSYTNSRAFRHPPSNDFPLQKCLKTLAQDNDIIITRADKGNKSVIMDQSDYDQKIDLLLKDDNYYTCLAKDPTNSIQNKMNKKINSLFQSGHIDNSQEKSLKCHTGRLPNFYGLPKIHKLNTPLRPIVNFTSSPLYALSKYLSSCLKPYTLSSTYSINSSFNFISALKNFNPPPNCFMFSLDVVSLYTSIPIDFAINTIRSFINNSSIPPPPPFDIDALLDLIDFCMRQNCFRYKDKYYRQIKGTAMGSPVSVHIAEIVMQFIENEINVRLGDKIYFWSRYVDDIFIISSFEDFDIIYSTANSINQAIQFTSEKETDHSLNFLDVSITFNTSTTSFDTTVYRKPTHTGQYLNFSSSSPISYKRNIFQNLLKRAKLHCSSNEAYNKEVKIIFKDLMNNNYNKKWLTNTYSKILQCITQPQPQPQPIINSNKKVIKFYVSIPYHPGISENISRILRPYNIQASFKPQNVISSLFAKKLNPVNPFDCTNVIYQIPCSNCDAVYIGETSRTANTRIKEHKRNLESHSQLSKLVLHALQHDHPPAFSAAKILSRNAKNYHSRIFLEGWFSCSDSSAINDSKPIPSEYTILL